MLDIVLSLFFKQKEIIKNFFITNYINVACIKLANVLEHVSIESYNKYVW